MIIFDCISEINFTELSYMQKNPCVTVSTFAPMSENLALWAVSRLRRLWCTLSLLKRNTYIWVLLGKDYCLEYSYHLQLL